MTTAPARALTEPRPAPARAGEPGGEGPGRLGLASPRALFGNLAQLLGSHAALALLGLASLPVLARNLGPAAYGYFSLFVTGLGLAANLDFSRPLLIRELARAGHGAERARLASLAAASAWCLAPLAALGGVVFLGPLAGVGLGLAVFLHASASASYAELAAHGRVGLAGALRNGAWCAALLAVVGLSFVVESAHAWVWPFVAANLALLVLYRRRAPGGPPFAAPHVELLRAHRGPALDLVGFGLAAAVLVAADKLLLERTASADEFGRYVAQYDLALKVNLLSTALGNVLYPALSRLHHERGEREAARHFVRAASWIAAGYFVFLATLLLLDRQVLGLALGDAFAGGFSPYPLLVLGAFVHLFGFLITPWQRARGDFRTHRRVYFGSAALMLLVGALAVPAYGVAGAAAAYLSARVGEVALVAHEARRTERGVLSRGRLAVLAAMALTLAALATWRVLAAGGAA